MAFIENPYKCDVCGRAKGEGNGWLLGIICDHGRHPEPGIIELGLCRPVAVDSAFGYAIVQWDEKLAFTFKDQIDHLCSEQCALTIQSQYIRK